MSVVMLWHESSYIRLPNRKQVLLFGGETSEFLYITTGVSQGLLSDPLIFIMYINYLEQGPRKLYYETYETLHLYNPTKPHLEYAVHLSTPNN